MTISAALVKELRNKTGSGVMDCREALSKSGGDVDKAMDFLRQKGLASAEKKSSRATGDGKIESYIHTGGKVGVLIEVNCETDFVAKTEEFNNLARELAMQVAALSPQYTGINDVPGEIVKAEELTVREIISKEGKKGKELDDAVEKAVHKFYKSVCLLEQPYIRDESKTISDLIKESVAKLGENITVKRFVRFALGDGK
ncbi:MAG: translation elongation factor Ts [Firmicutes bacterium]|nr:translation elongation factor Ts [Bacillota bacterium]